MHEYWQELRADGDFPATADFHEGVLGEDWLWSLIIGLGETPDEAVFRHVGNHLWNPDWGSWDGLSLRDCPQPSLLAAAVDYIPRVLDRQVPISIGGELAVTDMSILYRSILLPLSSNGSDIDGLLGAANFRPIGTQEVEES